MSNRLQIPEDLQQLLDSRDAAALLLQQLPSCYPAASLITNPEYERIWEHFGLHFMRQGQIYNALAIFDSLYKQLIAAQMSGNTRAHKGMPLVWMSDCYAALGMAATQRRYLMLTLIEDAIRDRGIIPPNNSGVYFRLVWHGGVSDNELRRYAGEIYRLHESNPSEARFPEWALQQLDDDWNTAAPGAQEASYFTANTLYVQHLLDKLGDGSGRILEMLAEYVLSCMPGCRTTRRALSNSTDYDIVCAMEGVEHDFRSELGRYFLCECKDWEEPTDFAAFAKFCRVLDSVRARFGILFSKNGITGRDQTKYAEREQLTRIIHECEESGRRM